jgi:TonB family protein
MSLLDVAITHTHTRTLMLLLMLTLVGIALGTACQAPGPAKAPREPNAVAPGEEPLETATVGDEEVVPLKPEPRSTTPPAGRPCAWAAVWHDPDAAHPLLSGVGGAPLPVKVRDAPISVPVREGASTGEIVVEILIDPNGNVSEASVVHAAEPRSPEVEAAVVSAVRKWRYDKPTFDGTPVALCSAFVLRP